ncbi:hypothetical protein AA15237_0734 [Komagataeibacter xylinus NBRC 15237]|nr:hypothetical protein AA16663_0999 [Komagataeibacter rhaeticus DSM 16663]GBQ69908.1 hypothetical protein AA15237_0734 [Komagataeibacter xylinus NBRC 15237]
MVLAQLTGWFPNAAWKVRRPSFGAAWASFEEKAGKINRPIPMNNKKKFILYTDGA